MALTDVKSEQIQSSVALAGSPTTTTQSASDNSTKIATTAYVETAVANLVASAPAALNTLDELAAALNDDASFSTTITNSIATKLPLAGGTLTGSLTTSGNLLINAASGNPYVSIKTAGTGNNPYVEYRAGNNIVFDNMLVASATTDYWRVGYGASGTITSEYLAVTSGGNVGIGETSPSELLHVKGTNGSIAIDGNGASNTASLKFINDNERSRITSAYDTGGGGRLTFHTDSTGGSLIERMRIDNDGNVGIGIINPSSYYSVFNDLVVGGSSDHGITIATGTSGSGTLAIADGTSGNTAYRAFFQYSNNTDKLFIGSGGATRITVQGSDGNVGIGTTNPYANLSLGAAVGARRFLVYDGGGVNNLYAGFGIDSPAANDFSMYAHNNGVIRLGKMSTDGSTITAHMTINNLGDVSIGADGVSSGGGNRLAIDTAVNAVPVTSGTTQTGGALRLRGGDNAVLDFGLNSTNTWIQATDKVNLANGYHIALNPNGGRVGVGLWPYAQFGVYRNQTDPYTPASFLDQPTMELKHPSTSGGYNGIRYTNTAGNYEWFTGTAQTSGNEADFIFQGYDRGGGTYKEMARIRDDGNLVKPYQIYFEVYRSGAQSGYNAASSPYTAVVIYNNVNANIGGHYNTSNGFFTAPFAGVYYFIAAAYTTFTCGQAWFSSTSGRLAGTDMVLAGMGQFPSAWIILKMAANDTVGFHPYASTVTNGTINANGNHTYFRGYLLG